MSKQEKKKLTIFTAYEESLAQLVKLKKHQAHELGLSKIGVLAAKDCVNFFSKELKETNRKIKNIKAKLSRRKK